MPHVQQVKAFIAEAIRTEGSRYPATAMLRIASAPAEAG
jgi:hypothetical protein